MEEGDPFGTVLAVYEAHYPLHTLFMRLLQKDMEGIDTSSQSHVILCASVCVSFDTCGRVPQYCLKAPRQLISLVLSSSWVSINILKHNRNVRAFYLLVYIGRYSCFFCSNIKRVTLHQHCTFYRATRQTLLQPHTDKTTDAARVLSAPSYPAKASSIISVFWGKEKNN